MFCAACAELRVLDLDEGIERALRENRRRTVSQATAFSALTPRDEDPLFVVPSFTDIDNIIQLTGQALQTEATVSGQRVELMDRTDFTTSVDLLAALVYLGLQSMSGDEVAHCLREVDASLAIVLITGWKLEVDTSSLAAFDFYLHKPFGPLQRVQTVVQRAVDLHQQPIEG